MLLKRLAAGRPEQNLALWGLRGVGKTVLLNRFAAEAEEAGWGSGYIELRGRGPLRPALAQVAVQAAQSLARRESVRERLRRSLSVISSFSVTAMPAGITFKVDVAPTPGRGDSGQLDVDLQDVLVELGETAREAEGDIAFFFDEMQFAEKEDLQALLAAFHRIAQRQLPVALGAGNPWDAACGGGPGGACPASGLPGSEALCSRYDVYAADIDLVGNTLPTVSDVGGPFVVGGTLSGEQAVSFDASDGESGVYGGSLVVDGHTVVSRVLDSNEGRCLSLGVTDDGRRSFEDAQHRSGGPFLRAGDRFKLLGSATCRFRVLCA